MLQKLINIFSNHQNSETSDPCMLVFDPTKKKWMVQEVMNLLINMTCFLLCPFFLCLIACQSSHYLP